MKLFKIKKDKKTDWSNNAKTAEPLNPVQLMKDIISGEFNKRLEKAYKLEPEPLFPEPMPLDLYLKLQKEQESK